MIKGENTTNRWAVEILRDAQDPDYQNMLKRVGVAEILDPARNVAVNEKVSERVELDEFQGW